MGQLSQALRGVPLTPETQALVSEADTLLDKRYERASYVQELEAKVGKLEAQVTELEQELKRVKREKGLSSMRDGLTFNEHTGLWSDPASRLSYCGACLDKDKRNPLKSELPWGWRCSAVQSHYYNNPDAPDPNASLDDVGGPQGWMR